MSTTTVFEKPISKISQLINDTGFYVKPVSGIPSSDLAPDIPYELIREDTFTNATEADHDITVDSLGQPFALTDFVMWFETPKQSTYSKKGYYGQIHFYLNDTSNIIAPEPGGWEQQAESAAHGFVVYGEQHHGMMVVQATANTTYTNSGAIRYRYMTISNMNNERQSGIFPILDGLGTTECYIPRILIKSVTGTGHYKLYGRRRRT